MRRKPPRDFSRSPGESLVSVHPGMGANLVGEECSFRVWAPNAIAVSVCIWQDERMSQIPLAPEPSNSSYWSVDVADVVAGQPYQFSIINQGGDPTNRGGILTRVDAYARQVESAEDNARGIVVDWQQEWSEFATPKFADLIIYEAHVGSFAGLNDHLNISAYATFADSDLTPCNYYPPNKLMASMGSSHPCIRLQCCVGNVRSVCLSSCCHSNAGMKAAILS